MFVTNVKVRHWRALLVTPVLLASACATGPSSAATVQVGSEPSLELADLDKSLHAGGRLNHAIIFETDFNRDAGYDVRSVNNWNQGSEAVSPPWGWDAIIATGDSRLSVEPGLGVNGKNALKIEWDPRMAQPTVSLVKHLTGNTSTGFDELYIRYHVKLPGRFKAGEDASYIPYWKWGRLWQNTSPDGKPKANNLSENRPNSGYVVWGFGGEVPYTMMSAVWSENTGLRLDQGSAGGERQGIDYFVSGADRRKQDGYFESMGDGQWALDPRRAGFLENQQQRFHMLEFRFNLASSESAEDGIFEMWWDGEKQSRWTRIGPGYGSGAPQRKGIPTVNRGSGFNLFTFFDNLTGWNRHWSLPDVDGFLLVNDVVVSQTPIGVDYIAGSQDFVR